MKKYEHVKKRKIIAKEKIINHIHPSALFVCVYNERGETLGFERSLI